MPHTTSPRSLRTLADGFLEAPIITSFSPGSGYMGQQVILTGTGLRTAYAVTFASTVVGQRQTASLQVAGDTTVTTYIPAGAASGTIQITTLGGTAETDTGFTVTAPPAGSGGPQIAGITPNSGKPGEHVVISGSGFVLGPALGGLMAGLGPKAPFLAAAAPRFLPLDALGVAILLVCVCGLLGWLPCCAVAGEEREREKRVRGSARPSEARGFQPEHAHSERSSGEKRKQKACRSDQREKQPRRRKQKRKPPSAIAFPTKTTGSIGLTSLTARRLTPY